jgi:hypothetical protein
MWHGLSICCESGKNCENYYKYKIDYKLSVVLTFCYKKKRTQLHNHGIKTSPVREALTTQLGLSSLVIGGLEPIISEALFSLLIYLLV